MTRFNKFSLPIFIVLICFGSSFAQIKIKELPPSKPSELDSVYFDVTQTRSISELTNGWVVYPEDDPNAKIQTNIPAVFEGADELIFEKELGLVKNSDSKKPVENIF